MSESSSPAHPAPLWRRMLSIAGCVFLGAVLLLAAAAKSLDPAAFADEIRLQGLDLALPA